ncbi:hypothetical protein TREMEDRAFT_61444 [Tremella mesenterica DSM 1558]|uniref:uncharacterized protein n=1 Tax=Tremella mesenterica (strain ATCC 24925 / CBS 8224 / DSM 1558 / NBRC 9311 / NRRL Y-6157 / RJB 2259-6 / UBC 559-6) TaxID=578456 RepID=UPI0003F4A01B|nr:uncharacterized protein TREMEDRAFT_61444 [Tremella mesenterica DSM 1558]EIW70932.1 hypothetical protein TREMEDRAFT_61444 [Tremella mesenterica DSM 1558]
MLTTISLFALLLPLALGSKDQSPSNQRRATYTDVLLKSGDQSEPSCLGAPLPLQSGGQVVAVDCNETDGTHILLWNLSDGQGEVTVSLGDEPFAIQAGGSTNDESVFFLHEYVLQILDLQAYNCDLYVGRIGKYLSDHLLFVKVSATNQFRRHPEGDVYPIIGIPVAAPGSAPASSPVLICLGDS